MTAARQLVIVGGGPAGLAAARGYRAAGGDGAVTLLAGERRPPYQRPPLSKELLRGELEPDDVHIEDPGWFAEHDVALRTGARAAALDPPARIVLTGDGESVPYDAVVLATGAEAAVLPIEGADHPEVLRLRRVEDALRLRERAEPGRRAVVVGSGFIGCEAAASLAMRGLAVTLVSDEPVPHEARLGADAGDRIAGWLTELGVELRLGTGVELIADGRRVHLPGSAPLEADLVLVGGGITPNAQLAEAAGVPLERGRVVVDEHMRTGRDGILAAGDVAFAHNAAAGRPLAVEHWGEALNMGETAGRVAAGEDASWAVAPGFWSTIGPHVLKYAAWGDGHDEARYEDHGGPFTVWYGRDGITVGVLAHERDEDYERGRELVETGARLP